MFNFPAVTGASPVQCNSSVFLRPFEPLGECHLNTPIAIRPTCPPPRTPQNVAQSPSLPRMERLQGGRKWQGRTRALACSVVTSGRTKSAHMHTL